MLIQEVDEELYVSEPADRDRSSFMFDAAA